MAPQHRRSPLPPSPAVTAPKDRWVLLVTIMGSALVIIDVTAMNVIAPSIQSSLDTSVAGVQWVIEAYTLFLASVTLVGGALADRFGRRRIFGLGLAGFAMASLACGLAPDVGTLIVARGLQGLGGALMLPGSLALIGAHFPAARRGRAIGFWSGMTGLMAVLGPVLGGVLSDIGSWRWIFYLNVPIGLGLLVPLTLVPESRRARRAGTLDLVGAALATLGLGAITYGLIDAGLRGWSHPLVLTGILGGIAVLGLFLVRERYATDPMLPLRVFRNRTFSAANGFTLFLYLALAAGMFFVPMRLIFLEGYSPSRAGFAMLPTILMIGLLSPRTGALTDRFGARPLLIIGATIAAIGFAVLAIPEEGTSYWAATFWGLTLVGLGMSAVIAPLTAAVLGAVPEDDIGVASGVNNAISRTGALLAIALSGLIALAVFSHWLAADLDELGLDEDAEDAAWRTRVDLAAADPPPKVPEQHHDALEAVYDRAFLAGYRGVQLAMATSAAIGAVVATLGLPRRLLD